MLVNIAITLEEEREKKDGGGTVLALVVIWFCMFLSGSVFGISVCTQSYYEYQTNGSIAEYLSLFFIILSTAFEVKSIK
jgi:hypothetical protein